MEGKKSLLGNSKSGGTFHVTFKNAVFWLVRRATEMSFLSSTKIQNMYVAQVFLAARKGTDLFLRDSNGFAFTEVTLNPSVGEKLDAMSS